MIRWFKKGSQLEQYKKGYMAGYLAGSRESTAFLRDMIVSNALNDSLIVTNTDTVVVERFVEIVENS
jgi:hypothetical protein